MRSISILLSIPITGKKEHSLRDSSEQEQLYGNYLRVRILNSIATLLSMDNLFFVFKRHSIGHSLRSSKMDFNIGEATSDGMENFVS